MVVSMAGKWNLAGVKAQLLQNGQVLSNHLLQFMKSKLYHHNNSGVEDMYLPQLHTRLRGQK